MDKLVTDNSQTLVALVKISNELLLLVKAEELALVEINEKQIKRDEFCQTLFSQPQEILAELDKTLLQEYITLDQAILSAATEKKANLLQLALNQKMNTKALKAYK